METIKHENKNFFFKLNNIKTIKRMQFISRVIVIICGVSGVLSIAANGLNTTSLALCLVCYAFINWINQCEIQIMRHKVEAFINEQEMIQDVN